MLTTVRRRAGRLTTGLLVLLALGLAAVFIVPKALGYDLYAITTGSMAGTVDPGGLVVAEQVPIDDLRVGDVITYLPPPTSGVDHLVTHRIVGIEPDRTGALSYSTKGDANPAADPWTFTLESPVQARMVGSAPLLGQPVLLLADPDVRRLVIVVPALLIGLLALGDVFRALRPLPVATVETMLVDLTAPVDVTIDLTGVRPARAVDLNAV